MGVQFALKLLEHVGLLCSVATTPGDCILMPSPKNMNWNEKFQLRILVPKRQTDTKRQRGDQWRDERSIQGVLVYLCISLSQNISEANTV